MTGYEFYLWFTHAHSAVQGVIIGFLIAAVIYTGELLWPLFIVSLILTAVKLAMSAYFGKQEA